MAFHYGPDMFVVTVTYTAPLDEVDRWRPAHGDWLNHLISQRLLLLAGRQVPLVGGVYLAPRMPAEELDRLLATDPYVLNGVAAHTVVEFTPMLVATGLEDLKPQE
ncbi:YciI family protein [Nonomuraea sp. NPDC000554]|uniref:YciI family protein n=1 Tax=Nonomuraea sp. NPDC000554 TaxID=3154259 RepID=UPI00331E7D6B